MITQRDMDKILADVNRVLANLSSKIEGLEEEIKSLKKTPTTTTAKSQNKT